MIQNEFNDFKALLSTIAEYYGKPLKTGAIMLWWNALSAFEFPTVKQLLTQHVQTCKFMPTIAELLDAMKALDGRPDAEEAWSIVARSLTDEGVTVVRTSEMAHAFGVALGLQDDRIAARMAFKEAYVSAVDASRRQGIPIKWEASLGHDPHGREGPLLDAITRGRLTREHVAGLLPYREEPSVQIQVLMGNVKRLTLVRTTMPEGIRAQLGLTKESV